MRKKYLFLFIAALLLNSFSCNMNTKKDSKEKWKNEILEAEQSFAKMLSEEGMDKAFLAFAAEDGVLMRNNTLIVGKEKIKSYVENKTTKGLAWKPDFVDVAASGDMAYTYGQYTFLYTDEDGKEQEDKGIFHTVWKRQSDGSWKFVWD